VSEKPFPIAALAGCENAVCFFCAGFYGENAEEHVRDAGIDGLGIDIDEERIVMMAPLFPRWQFVIGDAYEWLEALVSREVTFDLVTADPQINQFARCWDLREDFLALSDRALVLGIGDKQLREARRAGASVMPRAKGSWWASW